MRVERAGLEGRRPGQAVVVFESGAGQPIEKWSDILPAVAPFAPVLAYERLGTGLSEWDELPPTPQHSTAVLRNLLETLDVPPPYILGGILIRYFAERYPGDVVGPVYIDPTDIRETPDDHIHILESIGAPPSALEAFEAEIDEEALARVPAPIRAESEAMRGLLDRDVEGRAIPTPPSIPTAVILAGGWCSIPSNANPCPNEGSCPVRSGAAGCDVQVA